MKPSTFIAALEAATPTVEELREYGLDENEIEGIQLHFRATPRSVHFSGWSATNEIEELLCSFDCSKIEIGHVRFLAAPSVCDHGTMVARDEADPIVIRADGSVAMCDHAEPTHQLLCAVDAGRFLAALAAFVGVVKDRSIWFARHEQAIDMCAALAGGLECRPFFSSMCGVLTPAPKDA